MNDVVCTICPRGCRLLVDGENGFKVSGQGCARGAEYGKSEVLNPTRVVASTVRITGAVHRRCPVKTAGAIPKRLIPDAVRLLDSVELESPVAEGQIVVEDVCGTKIPFVATRSL